MTRGRSMILLCAFVVGCAGQMGPMENGGSGGGPGSGGSGGTSSNQLDIYQSGSRIKMRVGTTPDGAKEFIGWRDTQRNENCSFFTSTDGMRRCLPVFDEPTAGTGNSYSDMQCTMLVAGTCS